MSEAKLSGLGRIEEFLSQAYVTSAAQSSDRTYDEFGPSGNLETDQDWQDLFSPLNRISRARFDFREIEDDRYDGFF